MFDIKNFPLPFEKNDLSPYVSHETMNFHHDKHLNAYIDNLNKLIKDTEFENDTLKTIIIKSSRSKDTQSIFNNAAQVFNHKFFFNSLKVDCKTPFPKKLFNNFNSLEDFKTQFKIIANSVFGSGWVWLVLEAGEYKIVKTSNADTPIAHNQTPLLCIDLWEHAYYLDYQNRRAEFIDIFVEHLINWDFVESNL